MAAVLLAACAADGAGGTSAVEQDVSVSGAQSVSVASAAETGEKPVPQQAEAVDSEPEPEPESNWDEFPVGVWEYMYAQPMEDYPSPWMPVAYILTLREDGTATLLLHVKNSELIAGYEGAYTFGVDAESGVSGTLLTLELTRVYLENDYQPQDEAANAADSPHAVFSIRPEEPYWPMIGRMMLVLREGDPVFPGQEQGWPVWLTLMEAGEWPYNALLR